MIGAGEATGRAIMEMRARAEGALERHARDPLAVADPMQAASMLAIRAMGKQVPLGPLLSYLGRREQMPHRTNWRRYPWITNVRAQPGDQSYAGPRVNWRPREGFWLQNDPTQYAERLVAAPLLATHLQLWSEVALSSDERLAEAATSLLQRALPVAEADVAVWIAAIDPWRDTFALWQVSSRPLALAHVRDLVQALANRYGRLAIRDGTVRGSRYPFFNEPLVSGSAQLALSLWRLGTYPRLLRNLVPFVRTLRRPDGGWQDGTQPTDLVTTLAAAELLTALDPTFDPEPTIGFFARRQEPWGWWRALGPEVPWLTASISDWVRRATGPFARRFSWPVVSPPLRDRTTGLATIAFFDEIALAVAELPELAAMPMELAFIDLAGFGEYNSAHGQVAGDTALRLYAEAIQRIPDALVVRDGGDEILVLGLPDAADLEPQLEAFRRDWPRRATVLRGAPDGVVPRIMITSTRGGDLRAARRTLGIEIGVLKKDAPAPGPEGVLRRA